MLTACRYSAWVLWVAMAVGAYDACAQGVVEHRIKVVIEPDSHSLLVRDEVTIPASEEKRIQFILHGDLELVAAEPSSEILVERLNAEASGHPFPVSKYTLTKVGNSNTVTLHYQGKIFHSLERAPQEARRFVNTPGIISEQGVMLDSGTAWYPQFDDNLVSFVMEVELPGGWEAVSQGMRDRHERSEHKTNVRWVSPEPQDDIYLVAARFHETTRTVGGVELQTFLRAPDKALADRYLDASATYIESYSKILGPYPYGKFAMVENFWQSGYGMPSFTLLGSQIIRFPFILHSSYPHEILHNWWGNGVYVDYRQGNWSEGLTAYLADHLIQEQGGHAVEYRRATLQKYSDFVSAREDFALSQFGARHSPESEAVGYGKALMFFHMLRRKMGDENFVEALRAFYRHYKFRRANYTDIAQVFAGFTPTDLGRDFDQWVHRAGAPSLHVSSALAQSAVGGYKLVITLLQTHKGPAYVLDIPIAITLEGQEAAYQTQISMTDKALEVTVPLARRPLRLDVDPEFDVFRRLHPDEVPPALSRALGADKVLVLLPSAASESQRSVYDQLAHAWRRSNTSAWEVKLDSEIDELPLGYAIWLLGWDNRFLPLLQQQAAKYGVQLSTGGGVAIGAQMHVRKEHAFVLTTDHPSDPITSLSWLASDNAAAVAGLARKTPHYSKYSYLVFSGDEPSNVAKGVWPLPQSSMALVVTQGDGKLVESARGRLAPRHALSQSLEPH